MTRLVGRTVACMATFPERYGNLAAVVGSLAPQVDAILVYSNQHRDPFPDLTAYGDVRVFRDHDHAGDLSASGKVYPIDFLEDCLVFTVDDDFIYPCDYVDTYRRIFEAFDYACCLTAHGSVFPPVVRWYYERATTYPARNALPNLTLVSLGGSGTFAFHQRTLDVRFADFAGDVMVDLAFSVAARTRGLPIWSVPRPEEWLRHLGDEGLWQAFRSRMTPHTAAARRHDWSFEAYRAMARDAIAQHGAAADAAGAPIDPELVRAVETDGPAPSAWRLGRDSLALRRRYYELLDDLSGA